ncbi:polysaccharide pyruvyl transferase family protein [Nesterenkonia sandarakina]|uniref:Polysaccharide pyruvyl transferase n=1 Tax=Nesterenkonia sandarakina TaxID=272918 RepID=A0A2T0YSY8_9MICC|nr:polysaccharide pyruvyl transferase family protein [Nesterenkonia sandarakina]PRZ18892.1 polysaccharide pyruvyl transferase [Nesterenkonia sandarakina]
MPTPTVLAALYDASRAAAWTNDPEVVANSELGDELLTWDVPTAYGLVSVHLRETGRLTATGETENLRRLLRNVLVTKALLRATPHEHHVLDETVPMRGRADRTLKVVHSWVRSIQTDIDAAQAIENGQPVAGEAPLQAFWWDRKANFGDAVGPWLAAALTKRDVVNVRPTKENPIPVQGRATALVGSIIHMINREDMDIWGAGLMRPLSAKSPLRKFTGIRVHAVRGHLTRHELQTKLGWDVPEVLGDPALLLARHYTPRPSRHAEPKIAFVPHMSHRPRFKTIDDDVFDVVDVRDDLTLVVDAIANSTACVSTSLHGLIVAQTYGVPWVWLNITDAELGGGDFKFRDFFSTLRGATPAQVDVTLEGLADLDLAAVARRCSLPELDIDLEALEAALPMKADEPKNVSLRQRLGRLVRRLQGR